MKKLQIKMPFENNLPDFVQCAFSCIDLHKNVFTRDILIDHPINCIDLPDNFLQSFMKIFSIHTLTHKILLKKLFLMT